MALNLGGRGSVGGRNRGNFAAGTQYLAGDIVFNAGAAYYANVDFTSGATFNAADWTPFPTGVSVGAVWIPITLPGDLSLITTPVPIAIPRAITIQTMKAAVGTPPVGGPVVLDVFRTGTSVFTDVTRRPTINAAAKTSVSSIPNIASFTTSDYMTVSVVSVGPTTPGSDLTLVIRALEA